MSKDINIHIKTPGAAQAKEQLKGVGRASQQVGDKTSHGARKGAEGMDGLSSSTGKTEGRFSKLTSSIKSWVTGIVGIAVIIRGITAAIRLQSEAIKEHARIATEQQKKLLALQAMGTFFEEHPEARKEVAAYAKAGVRPFEDVAEAWYSLESKGAGLTKEQKAGIMRESLELGRMEPEADLASIVDVFSIYAKETRQKDINQIQNVIRQTLSKAGAELSQMGQYLPQFLPLGTTGGLTGAETAGLWAFATTRAPSPEKATVGIRNIFMALQGKGTPESQKLLQGLGITPEMDIFQQLSGLSAAQKAGKLGTPEAETIAGKESAAILMSMLTEPKAMMETVGAITGVARPDIDITKEKLKQIMDEDEVARLEENLRRTKIEIQNIKAQDVKALKWAEKIESRELALRKKGVSEVRIALERKELSAAAVTGISPEEYESFKSFAESPVFEGVPQIDLLKFFLSKKAPAQPEGGVIEEEVPIKQKVPIKQEVPIEQEVPVEQEISTQQGAPVIVNDNSINTNYNPIAGTDEDRGKGTRGFSPGVY